MTRKTDRCWNGSPRPSKPSSKSTGSFFGTIPTENSGRRLKMYSLMVSKSSRSQTHEFGVKYRVLREAPRQSFLIYREGPRPADIDNWLLDVELAHGVFKSDQVAMWLSELGLPANFDTLVRAHERFLPFRPSPGKTQDRLAARPDTRPGCGCGCSPSAPVPMPG